MEQTGENWGLNIENWPLSRIKPYPGNPRKRSKLAIDKVAASIREFGWRQPIVVDEDGVILVGHTRRDAAELLGMETAPVHVARGLTEAQKRAYRIADNRTNDETAWDPDKLAIELGALRDMHYDLGATAMNARELQKYAPAGAPDADSMPEPDTVEAVTEAGDVWQLGGQVAVRRLNVGT